MKILLNLSISCVESILPKKKVLSSQAFHLYKAFNINEG
jgi:hypothetical protein